MRNRLRAMLCSYGLVSRGLAFAPPSSTTILLQSQADGRSRADGVTRSVRLFSPQHGDHDGPIVSSATRSSKEKVAAAGKKVAREAGGGWGSWEKVVSQREEQESVLKRLTLAGDGLRVRTVTKADMFSISRLCIDTFRGPFQWFELPVQLFQEFAFFGQIQGRLGRVTRNEIKHSMVIAEDTTTSKVVGFLEIGMLPKPSSSEENALAQEALITARAEAAVAAATAAAAAAAAAAGGKKKGQGKRRGQAEAVEPPSPQTTLGAGANVDGAEASVGEAVAGAEEGRGVKDKDSSSTAIRREKQPDVAYLANVVVDKTQRRRGIGRAMVSSAIEVVKELWPAEENIYVSVEKGNDIALALYEGMGFELAALEDELMARGRRRPPRMYLSKSLT